MSVAIYVRVSSNHQSKGMESQETALLAYCTDRKLGEPMIFKDFAISGGKESRPGLNDLMAACREGKISLVCVYSFSRFARSTKHLLSALEFFNTHQIGFVSLSEDVNTATPVGKIVFTLLAAIAEFERETIRDRIRNGMRNAKAKGRSLGRPKQRDGRLIRELHAKNLSQRQIAKMLGISRASVQVELKQMRQAAGNGGFAA